MDQQGKEMVLSVRKRFFEKLEELLDETYGENWSWGGDTPAGYTKVVHLSKHKYEVPFLIKEVGELVDNIIISSVS